jgi:hypothetical protein
VPLRNTDDAVMANWLELVTTDARGAIVFKNAWVRISLSVTGRFASS